MFLSPRLGFIWLAAMLLTGYASPVFAQMRGGWSEIAAGYAGELHGIKRLDDPPPYAITHAVASREHDLVAAGAASLQWYFPLSRVKSALNISSSEKPFEPLAEQLADILTMEAVTRTVDRFGFDKLSPQVADYFRDNRRAVGEYLTASRYIFDAYQAYAPTWIDEFVRNVELDRMSFGQQITSTIVDHLYNSAREGMCENMIAHEWRGVTNKARCAAWQMIRGEIVKSSPSPRLTPTDFEVTCPLLTNAERAAIQIRNTSGRSLSEITVILEDKTRAPTVVGYHIPSLTPGQARLLVLSNSPLFVSPERTRQSTDLHLVVADEFGPIIAARMSQRPAARWSYDSPGVPEIILEDTQPVLAPQAVAKRLKAELIAHNKVVSEASRGIKAEQSRIGRQKRHMSPEHLDLFQADSALTARRELPSTFHTAWRQNVVASSTMLADELNDLRSLAEFYRFDDVARHILVVQENLSKAKPLELIPVPTIESVAASTHPLFVARSNLETFIQLAETRLQAVETKIADRILRAEVAKLAPLLEELQKLRLEGVMPASNRESEAAYFVDLDTKFRNSMQRIRDRDASREPLTARVLDAIEREYDQRYLKLLANLTAN